MNQLKKAVEVLKKGRVVAYPTETVYGLGADGFNKSAIKKVFKLKRRDRSKPISLAVADFNMMDKIVHINSKQKNKLKKVLPGPITILASKTELVPDIVTAGSDKVGVRFPNHEKALNLIKKFNKPITATSANKSGHDSISNYHDLDLNVDYILKGVCGKFQPSTVYDLISRKIIRKGPGDKLVLLLK